MMSFGHILVLETCFFHTSEGSYDSCPAIRKFLVLIRPYKIFKMNNRFGCIVQQMCSVGLAFTISQESIGQSILHYKGGIFHL